MNYIYDIVLNFNSYSNCLEFYEWLKGDKLDYIEKIPIIKINSMQLEDILFKRIKINDNLLDKIYNKTITSTGVINYSLLVTDSNKVLGLKFNNKGLLVEKSNLLLDEEEAVLEEINDLDMEYFDYEVIEDNKEMLFLTRYERLIRESLLKELNNLYDNKMYDEIEYLYYEIFNENCSIQNKYKKLINNIRDNFNYKFISLYRVIELSIKKA